MFFKLKALAENRKLELRFRPQDPYCKPAYGTMNKVSSLLLKVKRRRKSNPADSHILDGGDDSNAFEYKVEILGIITSSYKFQGSSKSAEQEVHVELVFTIIQSLKILSYIQIFHFIVVSCKNTGERDNHFSL